MAYGFVPAGYSAAIVALPAIAKPYGVFDSAVMRVSEVLLGIGVSALVSELVLPEPRWPTRADSFRACKVFAVAADYRISALFKE